MARGGRRWQPRALDSSRLQRRTVGAQTTQTKGLTVGAHRANHSAGVWGRGSQVITGHSGRSAPARPKPCEHHPSGLCARAKQDDGVNARCSVLSVDGWGAQSPAGHKAPHKWPPLRSAAVVTIDAVGRDGFCLALARTSPRPAARALRWVARQGDKAGRPRLGSNAGERARRQASEAIVSPSCTQSYPSSGVRPQSTDTTPPPHSGDRYIGPHNT